MKTTQDYPIGVPGIAWGDAEKSAWLARQSVQRRYDADVETKIHTLGDAFHTEHYGSLAYSGRRYTLYALMSKHWDPALPNILITGGVHGYETSGVMGALRFMESAWEEYAAAFNFLVLPCISPWAFETINRWNPLAVDPNRSFRPDSAAEESVAVMAYLHRSSLDFLAHFDLHETTDTDNSEFRPALAARDAKSQYPWEIPDGFYAVADTERPAFDFQKAIIESVAKVTHIAPPTDGKIIGETLQQAGVICYEAGKLGLCMGLTDAPYVTTTEVYPDSPEVTDEECVAAQLAAIRGGLDYLLTGDAK